MYDLYRCKVRVGYKFFNSNRMVVFDEDQIASVDLKLRWEGSFFDLNADTMVSKLMLYTSEQNTCSVSIKDPYFTSIAWPALLDVAGQTISNSEYTPGVTTILRECGKDEDPKKDGCYRYEQFNYTTYFGTGFDGTDPNEIFTTEDSVSYRYVPAMLLISLWYETPNGYTFGTDYIYMVTNTSVSHGSNYPTVDIAGSGNYGVVFQNGLMNMSISDKDNIEFSISEIVKKLGYEPTFCNANYDEPRKLDRKVALRNVTAGQGIDKIVKEYLGGDTMSLPTKDFFKKLHICTRSDGAVGRKVFYLGKPLYESYNITAKYDQTFLGRNLEKFGSNNLVPGQQGSANPSNGTSAGGVSTYKLEELSTKDTSATIIKHSPQNPIKDDTFSGSTYTIKGVESGTNVVSLSGEWKDFKSDRDIYLTVSDAKQFFLKVDSPTNVTIETLNKVSSWYAGSWSDNNVYSPIRGELISNDKGIASIRSDIHLFLRGNTTNEISSFPIYTEIRNIDKHESISTKFVLKGEKLGTKGKSDVLMRFYIINAGSHVYIDLPTLLEFAIEENATLPGATTPVKSLVQKTAQQTPQPPATTIKSNGVSIDMSKLTKLKELIISGESAKDRNEAANLGSKSRGTISRYTGGKKGSEITIAQLMKLQEEGKIFAIGWPQIIPDTLKKVVNSGAINPSLKFTDETQDAIFMWLIKQKRPNVYAYLSGSNDDVVEAAQDIAREWAAFGISKPEAPEAELRKSGVTIKPDHKRVRNVGQSLYSGINANKASISPKTLQNTLKKIKSQITTTKSTQNSGSTSTTSTTTTSSQSSPSTPASTGYVWPTTGNVSSVYGPRIHPISGVSKLHAGWDISRPMGTDIVAAASGEVVEVYTKCANSGSGGCGKRPFSGYGNIVYIKHSNGQYTLYAHLKSNILVKKGDSVNQKQKIGEMGSSGWSTGPHLHFEIRDSSGKALDFSTKRSGQVNEGDEIPLKIDASGVVNYNGASMSSGDSINAVPAYGLSNAGFTIETEFKGIPRALRLVPRFTTLSLVSSYQEWLKSGKSNTIDPGIWVADEFFRNWIINSVAYTWKEGDLRVRIEGSSPLGMNSQSLVPKWELFQEALRAQGYKDSYIDYIRSFGDLCWTDETGYNSCEDPTLAIEIFEQMQNNASSSGVVGNSVSNSAGQCNTDPLSIDISAQEFTDLLNMIAAEAGGESLFGQAMVSRAILNRWIVNRETKGGNPYGVGSGKRLRDVLFAKNSSGWEFSPMGNGALKAKKSDKALKNAQAAFRMSLNTDYLIANGIRKDALTFTNFRVKTLANGSNWVGSPYTIENHKFAADGRSSQFDLFKLWEKYYGKCVPISSPSSTTNSTVTPGKSCDTKYGHYAYTEPPKEQIIEVGTYNGRKEYLHKDAAEAFNKMKAEASTQGHKLVLISGYRSVSYQKGLFEAQVKRRGSEQEAAKYSAPPGYSEHHTGYTLDIGDQNNPNTDTQTSFENTGVFKWLKSNASKFGFELSFQKNNSQGISYEPWHWRFVGNSQAKAIMHGCKKPGTVTKNIKAEIDKIRSKYKLQSIITVVNGYLTESSSITSVYLGSLGKISVSVLVPLVNKKLLDKRSGAELDKLIKIDTRLQYDDGNYQEPLDTLTIKTVNGARYTSIRRLTIAMLKDSNNTAANILIQEVLDGPEKATKLGQDYFKEPNLEIGFYGPITRKRMGQPLISNRRMSSPTRVVMAAWLDITSKKNVSEYYKVANAALFAPDRNKMKGDTSLGSKIGITTSVLGNVGRYPEGDILIFQDIRGGVDINSEKNQYAKAQAIIEIRQVMAQH